MYTLLCVYIYVLYVYTIFLISLKEKSSYCVTHLKIPQSHHLYIFTV